VRARGFYGHLGFEELTSEGLMGKAL
jgi:hypothetical protein